MDELVRTFTMSLPCVNGTFNLQLTIDMDEAQDTIHNWMQRVCREGELSDVTLAYTGDLCVTFDNGSSARTPQEALLNADTFNTWWHSNFTVCHMDDLFRGYTPDAAYKLATLMRELSTDDANAACIDLVFAAWAKQVIPQVARVYDDITMQCMDTTAMGCSFITKLKDRK